VLRVSSGKPMWQSAKESRLAGSDPRDPARETMWIIEFNLASARRAEDLIVHNHSTGSGSVRPLEGR
jgi:hypothetical protein